MTDPGDEHQERVAPNPACSVPAAGGEFKRLLAELEHARKRHDDLYKARAALLIEAQRLEAHASAVYSEIQVLQLAIGTYQVTSRPEIRRFDRDRPVRLNRANNSWEEL